jgi:uncharacterized protein
MQKKSPVAKYWSTYVLLMLFLVLMGGLVGYVYYETQKNLAAVTAYEPPVNEEGEEVEITLDNWELLYPNTISMKIADVYVQASVAKSWPDRIKGLSGTPFLPPQVVKFFEFESDGLHSIWMKDMNYSIDIIWVDADSNIVHIEEGATPESFPAMFVPATPARYVIETVDGFVKNNQIKVGDKVELPKY